MLEHRALHQDVVLAADLLEQGRGHVADNRLGDHAVVPGDDPALGIEASLDVVGGHRAELARLHVVLAAPDQLHRFACGLGEPHRVYADIGGRPAAVAAAQPMLMHGDAIRRCLKELRHRIHHPGRTLRADPDFRRLAIRRNDWLSRLAAPSGRDKRAASDTRRASQSSRPGELSRRRRH